MVKLPSNVNINNLIDYLRIISWEAADILLHYALRIKDINYKDSVIKNNDHINPVTLADLEVNDLILKRMQFKYPNI